jgi:PIN like domain
MRGDIAIFLRRIRNIWTIELHTDHLARGLSDVDVIRHCAERGWIIISCDDRIRYVPENKAALHKYGGRVFAFPQGNYQGVEYGAALIVARTQIVSLTRKTAAPFYGRIFIRGEASMLEPQTTKASTSREKTAAKYGANVLKEKG